MPSAGYSAHEDLVAPARPGRALWRLIVGLVIVAGVVLGLNTLAESVIFALNPGYWRAEFLLSSTPGGAPLSMLILLGSFGFIIIGVRIAARMMQKRDLAGMVGRSAWTQFLRVFRALSLLGLVLLILPPWDMGLALESNLGLGKWLVFLPVSLIAIAVQVSAEEILFRGYIQQSLAARFSSPLVWMVLPAGLFALGHYLPAEAGENAGLIALWAGIFACLMADLTARAGTMGPAIAVHLFNNMIALLLVALPGALSGLSLYLVPFDISDTERMRAWLAVDFAMMLVAWLTARLALGR